MSEYDVIVIGAGPGGYVSAIRASQLGLKTAVIEKKWMGGVCLNVGCIPSKVLLKNADVAHTLRHRGKELGFSFDNLELDYSAAVKRSRKVSKRLTQGVGFLMKKNNIDVYMGTARLLSKDKIEVLDEEGKAATLTAKNIVVAAGARSMPIPGMIPDGERILNYVDAILQESLPASAVIIGGGALGVEFATVWNSYGADITIVEMLPHLVPTEDEDVCVELEKAFKKAGIKGMPGYRVKSIENTGSGVTVKISGEDGEKTLEAEQALIAIGFKPNSQDIGLEELGVEMDRHGFIQVDERMATSVPGVWAIGDVTGKLQLAHVASAMGVICAEQIAGVETMTLDYRMMPRATYSHPQTASFGLTEAQAVEEGHEVKVGRFPFMANGKALGLGEHGGFIKIVTDAKYGEILGAHMIGPEVTELLPELTLAHNMELTVEEIARNVHAHPTLSEALMEAAHAVGGHAIHT